MISCHLQLSRKNVFFKTSLMRSPLNPCILFHRIFVPSLLVGKLNIRGKASFPRTYYRFSPNEYWGSSESSAFYGAAFCHGRALADHILVSAAFYSAKSPFFHFGCPRFRSVHGSHVHPSHCRVGQIKLEEYTIFMSLGLGTATIGSC